MSMARLKMTTPPSPARVTVDPNSVSRRDPALSVVPFEGAPAVYPGDIVIAVQPDDDGTAGEAPAVVESVDFQAGIMRLRVDWSRFRVVQSVLTSLLGTANAAGSELEFRMWTTTAADVAVMPKTSVSASPDAIWAYTPAGRETTR
ncbi:hypothetical protein GCM10009737_10900 [Nocardioides lentus]|uniref:Uncharacterized protein n=1 Tax=Nocardioides lentus TaxID=338077 RepID=A0ABN2P353_9ACTN